MEANNLLIINKSILKDIKHPTTAIMLSEIERLCHCANDKSDGWIVFSTAYAKESLNISPYHYKIGLKKLEDKGYIQVQKKGMPGTNYVKLINNH